MTGIFAPQYYGSVQYYAAMAACDRVIVDVGMRFDKRFKSVHRCQIVDTRGPLTLTVPISRPSTVDGPLQWSNVMVSSHGQWWSDHRISLESAYGRTPFFEFYIDRLLPYLCEQNCSITTLNQAIDQTIRSILHLPTPVQYLDCTRLQPEDGIFDYRRNQFPDIQPVPYYQVRAHRLGFVPNLSILDLICNMGPESPLVLHDMNDSIKQSTNYFIER